MQANIHQRLGAARADYEAAADALCGFKQGLGRPQLYDRLERDFVRASLAYEAVLVEYVQCREVQQ